LNWWAARRQREASFDGKLARELETTYHPPVMSQSLVNPVTLIDGNAGERRAACQVSVTNGSPTARPRNSFDQDDVCNDFLKFSFLKFGQSFALSPLRMMTRGGGRSLSLRS